MKPKQTDMSKRAEERALEAYPVKQRYNDYYGDYEDMNIVERVSFQEGYEQAEKDLGWHSVDESLPPIDKEVIVLTDELRGKKLDSPRRLCFAHRPDPEGWDGKDIITGKVTHHDPVLYDGWNIPGVKYWMPFPKLGELE